MGSLTMDDRLVTTAVHQILRTQDYALSLMIISHRCTHKYANVRSQLDLNMNWVELGNSRRGDDMMSKGGRSSPQTQ